METHNDERLTTTPRKMASFFQMPRRADFRLMLNFENLLRRSWEVHGDARIRNHATPEIPVSKLLARRLASRDVRCGGTPASALTDVFTDAPGPSARGNTPKKAGRRHLRPAPPHPPHL